MANTDKPLVSIVIPNRNGQEYLRQALESALQQTYPATEVIVVDDGSMDGSLSILDSFSDTICLAHSGGNGAPAARNAGLHLARGEFVKFLDADDILLRDCLVRQVEQALRLLPGQKAVVYGDALWVDKAGSPLPGYPHRPRACAEDSLVHMLQQSPLISCPLHKRAYLEEIGGFDPQFTKGQEHDLHVRLVLHGVEFIHFAGVVFHYRQHGDSARISNRSLAQGDPMRHFTTMSRQLGVLQCVRGPELSPVVNTIFSQRFWSYGRTILREGFPEEAVNYFVMAQRLDPKRCITGNTPYPALVRVLGPVRAEWLMIQLRKATFRFVR